MNFPPLHCAQAPFRCGRLMPAPARRLTNQLCQVKASFCSGGQGTVHFADDAASAARHACHDGKGAAELGG